jgi:hypothetical protein
MSLLVERLRSANQEVLSAFPGRGMAERFDRTLDCY